MSQPEPILRPGRNCWRLVPATRLAWLIDAEAYFATLYRVLCSARESILIVGWDIDSRIELLRDDEVHDCPVKLGELLNALLEERPQLHVHVLTWDFAMIYALERAWLPLYQFSLGGHARLHCHLDDNHPVGASHHQKIVVIDDAIAFCGGIDLTKARWDTSAHRADEPRRRSPDGQPYGPFHDIQIMVSGEAARALGGLARQRWYRATGDRLEAPATAAAADAWPEDIEADLEQHEVGIARTEPAHAGLDEVREIEQLYVDAIGAARRYIYIENQYLTAASVGDALQKSLAAASGPEILIVLPSATSGWLEQTTMDVLRARLVEKLTAADRHSRLRICCPLADDLGASINVHSKLMIVDDRFVLIGSANLSNRSMGLDTECDIALETDDDGARPAVAGLLRRLLAEHSGCSAERVGELCERHDGLFAAATELDGGTRRLALLEASVSAELDRIVPDSAIIDPERPMPAEQLFGELLEEHLDDEAQRPVSRRRRVVTAVATVAALLALAALWRFSPLSEWLSMDRLRAVTAYLQGQYWAPLAALGGFIVGGLVVAPVTALVIVTVLVFGGLSGFLYSMAGATASAALTYGLGAALGRRTIRQLAGPRVNRISERLGEQSLLTIAALRMVPVAPFTIVNVVAGASHIRFWSYLGGTLLGMLPGVAAISFVISGASAAFGRPSLGTIGMLLAGLGLLGLVLIGMRALLRSRSRSSR